MPHKKCGFTLVELLAVVAIIAILAAILLPALGRAKLRAQRGEIKTVITGMEAALKMYEQDNGRFPPSNGQGNNVSGPAGAGDYFDGALIRFLDGRASNDDNTTPTRPPIQYFEFPQERILANGNTPIFLSLFDQPFFYNELRTDNLPDAVLPGGAADNDPRQAVVPEKFRTFQIFNQAEALNNEPEKFITNYRSP